MVSALVGRPFSTGMALIVLLCASSASVAAQEPPRVGTNGVSVPALQTFAAPVYPAVALLGHPSWIVNAAALVGADGRVESVHVVAPSTQRDGTQAPRKLPDADENEVDKSVLDAVRQWVFAPPAVNGAAAAVVVPITVRFEVFSAPDKSFFTDTQPVSEMPSDFSMVYTQGMCTLDTRMGLFTVRPAPDTHDAGADFPSGLRPESRRLVLRGDELDSIYQEMRRVRLFEYPTAIRASYERGPSSQRDATWATTTDGILVVMRLENSGPMVRQPSALHRFEVQQNGKASSVTWDDAYNGPAITREIEGIRAVVNVVKRILERHQELRDLQAVAQDCRSALQ